MNKLSKIVTITSSLRQGSKTKLLSKIVHNHINKTYKNKYKSYHLDLAEKDIPRCDGKSISEYKGSVPQINKLFSQASGVIICFPVYGQSFPSVLKDLLDCTNTLYGKPVLLIEVLATNRSFLALQSLSNYLIFGHNTLIFPKFISFKDTEVFHDKLGQPLQVRVEKTIFDFIKMIDSLNTTSVLNKSLRIPKWQK
ncbi:MAG: NAD(P)H-dependent oxidoreductase [Candidatus Levybacteria bacterium]|nr:NAD(P)H-dependent oxidoreductase [Candidatus Levybacteria bacterium]